MRELLIVKRLERYLLIVVAAAMSGWGLAGSPVVPFEIADKAQPRHQGDRLVFKRLSKLGMTPAALCSDAVFHRRLYLDVIGTLPTTAETKAFLADKSPGKRSKLVDRLMTREEFADYWALKWCDLLRVKAEFPINLWPNAAQAYHRWVRTCLDENVPYDKFARDLLTASGSNFRVPQVNFYRSMQSKTPEAIAKGVALGFMGVRTDEWPEKKKHDLAAFFSKVGFKGTSEWKEEVVYFDQWKTNAVKLTVSTFPDGTRVRLKPAEDPRVAFTDWLVKPENPWFAANAVNRVWFWLMGRGIVHEPDDFRSDNPPQNAALLQWLAKELVSADYDLKHIYRLILNSRTYQQSAIPATDHPERTASFANYPVRRLDAEVLIDALCQITGTTEKYTSAIPEPFTFIPEDQRSIELMDGSISSPFLDMFGRPARDTGLLLERNNRPTAAQRLHLLNSSHIRKKFETSGKMKKLLNSKVKPQQLIARIYMEILSRPPTKAEIEAAMTYEKSSKLGRWRASMDLAWALINTKEFMYRH
jgi:hypothetical protein